MGFTKNEFPQGSLKIVFSRELWQADLFYENMQQRGKFKPTSGCAIINMERELR
jgi:hypothetical protein